MMQPLADGMNIDPEMYIQVLTNKLMQGTVKEMQMEAAIQTLIQEKQQLHIQIQTLSEVKAEDEDAHADSQ